MSGELPSSRHPRFDQMSSPLVVQLQVAVQRRSFAAPSTTFRDVCGSRSSGESIQGMQKCVFGPGHPEAPAPTLPQGHELQYIRMGERYALAPPQSGLANENSILLRRSCRDGKQQAPGDYHTYKVNVSINTCKTPGCMPLTTGSAAGPAPPPTRLVAKSLAATRRGGMIDRTDRTPSEGCDGLLYQPGNSTKILPAQPQDRQHLGCWLGRLQIDAKIADRLQMPWEVVEMLGYS